MSKVKETPVQYSLKSFKEVALFSFWILTIVAGIIASSFGVTQLLKVL